MYNPSPFKVSSRDEIKDFLSTYNFGTIFSSRSGELRTVSVPLIFDKDLKTLSGHIAIANSMWKGLDKEHVIVVFMGPNHYISPLWYEEEYAVPTWNYLSVLIKGQVRILISDEDKIRILDQLSDFQENKFNQGWKADWNDKHYMAQLKAIVAFEITIEEAELKKKLSQNHPRDNTRKVSQKLKEVGNKNADEIASLMEKL